jgi:hypothetical protein
VAHLRYAAAVSLGHIGPPAGGALPALHGALVDQVPGVRSAVAGALERITGVVVRGPASEAGQPPAPGAGVQPKTAASTEAGVW